MKTINADCRSVESTDILISLITFVLIYIALAPRTWSWGLR